MEFDRFDWKSEGRLRATNPTRSIPKVDPGQYVLFKSGFPTTELSTPSVPSLRVSDPSEELEERLQKEREASAEDQKWLQEASDAFIPVGSPKTPRASRLVSEDENDVVVKVRGSHIYNYTSIECL